ncbi:MAG TPA: hypothetical protein VKS21_11910 [Spirochaetota bacterium]|nr:hypothetical protein [Spirochaetota bacterium]
MKKTIILLCMLLSSLTVLMTACKDDNDGGTSAGGTLGTIAFDSSTYAGTAASATITLTDPDLSAGTVQVNVKSYSDTTGIGVTLIQAGTNYIGTVSFTTTSESGKLQVADGDMVIATYNDADPDQPVTAQATWNAGSSGSSSSTAASSASSTSISSVSSAVSSASSSSGSGSVVCTFSTGNLASTEWNGATGTFVDTDEGAGFTSTGDTTVDNTEDQTSDGGYAVKVDYNLTVNANGYAYYGFYIEHTEADHPGAGATGFDLSGYTTMYFKIRGTVTAGSDRITAVLRETDGTRNEYHIPAEKLQGNWTNISVSLTNFNASDGNQDWTIVSSTQFKVTSDGTTAYSNSFWVDDVYFD